MNDSTSDYEVVRTRKTKSPFTRQKSNSDSDDKRKTIVRNSKIDLESTVPKGDDKRIPIRKVSTPEGNKRSTIKRSVTASCILRNNRNSSSDSDSDDKRSTIKRSVTASRRWRSNRNSSSDSDNSSEEIKKLKAKLKDSKSMIYGLKDKNSEMEERLDDNERKHTKEIKKLNKTIAEKNEELQELETNWQNERLRRNSLAVTVIGSDELEKSIELYKKEISELKQKLKLSASKDDQIEELKEQLEEEKKRHKEIEILKKEIKNHNELMKKKDTALQTMRLKLKKYMEKDQK